jgi:hypothetical protein
MRDKRFRIIRGTDALSTSASAPAMTSHQRWFRRRVAPRGRERQEKREKAGLSSTVEQPEQAQHNPLQEESLFGRKLCAGCSGCATSKAHVRPPSWSADRSVAVSARQLPPKPPRAGLLSNSAPAPFVTTHLGASFGIESQAGRQGMPRRRRTFRCVPHQIVAARSRGGGRAQKGARHYPLMEPQEQVPRNLLQEAFFLWRVARWLFLPFHRRKPPGFGPGVTHKGQTPPGRRQG